MGFSCVVDIWKFETRAGWIAQRGVEAMIPPPIAAVPGRHQTISMGNLGFDFLSVNPFYTTGCGVFTYLHKVCLLHFVRNVLQTLH